jgi:tol-pal system-associated acyl-CoA thioesterase
MDVGAAPSALKAASFRSSVRVYYEDTDAQGVVYYANYLKFMERCRTDWLRHIGCDISAIYRDHGIIFAVRSTHVEYFRPARLSDLLTVTVTLEEMKKASFRLEQFVYRDEERLCRGTIRIASLDADGFGPVVLPAPIIAEINEWKMP